jgi:hypothetical protein
MKIITYGLGGFDKSKPNNNITEEVELPDEPVAQNDQTSGK